MMEIAFYSLSSQPGTPYNKSDICHIQALTELILFSQFMKEFIIQFTHHTGNMQPNAAWNKFVHKLGTEPFHSSDRAIDAISTARK